MWKKVWVVCVALIAVFTVAYGYFNYQMDAAPANLADYEADDKFERNDNTEFTMGGVKWKIVNTDSVNQKAYIISENLSLYASCGGYNLYQGSVLPCLSSANALYASNTTNDDMGDYVEAVNGKGTLNMVDLAFYLKMTLNNTSFQILDRDMPHFWMNEYSNGIMVAYLSNGGSFQRYTVGGVTYQKIIVLSTTSTAIVAGMEIDLPQKGIIKTITADQSNMKLSCPDPLNDANQVIVNIDTIEGEGPYHFYVYDTDAGGNGNYRTPSNYFSLTADPTNGTAKVHLIHKLPAGDYYFRVRVMDESMNERLYYDSSDFDQDPYRTKETEVIHVSVTKVTPTIAFDDPSQTKKSITQASAGWSETATATPSTGTKVTYAKSGGSVGLINIDPHTGAITYAGGGGYGKVTIKATADDDPTSGYDDYNSADTTKEIVIYREVDGSVTPHSNSSDTTTPTFQTSDANIKPNGIIGTITGTLGTPDNGTSGTTTYTYGLKAIDDHSFFSVNASTGEIRTTADLSTNTGTYHITVTVSDKWSTKEIPVTISVGLSPAENLKFYENSTSNTVINAKTVNFTDTNVSVFASVKGSTNTNPVTYSLKAGEPTNVIDINPNSGAVTIKGAGTVTIVATKKGASGQADATAELSFTVKPVAQNFIYTTDSTLSTERPKTGEKYNALKETYAPSKTFHVYTTGNPAGSTVTYQLKDGSPTDVISVDSDGTIHVLNASLNTQIGKVIVQATSHDPSGNYEDKTIELPIDIEKGERKVAFAENPIYVISGSGSVTPSVETDGQIDTSGNYTIEVDPNANSVAWTNDGETIQYDWSEETGKDVKIKVTKPADRNYKAAEGEGILHILGADENVLTLSTPGKITYGDHFTIRSTQDDSMSTNVQYSFETDNGVYISAPQVNGNKAEFDALRYSGSTEITIKVTRTADGELPLTKSVKIKVLPKPITIPIEDKEKKRLEDNPELTYKDFQSQLVVWNGVKDEINESVIKLSTTAEKYSPVGSYPITSKVQQMLNDNYPNYTFTIKEGKLNIKDNGNKNFWDTDDDGCPDLNIEIKDETGNTITINGDLNEDGIPDYNIDTNGDGKPDLNIDTDNDGKPDVNLVILKEWKPSKCVTLGDIQYSSGITAKPEINMDVDGDLIPDINIDTDGDFKADYNIDSDGDGKANVNIGPMHSQWKPDHDYKYQGFAYDSIGKSEPLLNIDTDGDGRPDLNLDLDDDGVADLNIDINGDRIPDINIDSSGDGKPDLNLDPDEDGNPTKNVIKLEAWNPEHNVEKPFAYDTMKIENKKELEDGGIKIEKGDGSTFPASMALKVIDVTAEKKEAVTSKAADFIKEGQEVKQVYEIKLLENGIEVKPDGILKIRIPIADDIKNPVLIRQKEDGNYEKINAIIEDGYLVYESDELGIVSIIGDRSSEIQGNYYPGENVGGAMTGRMSYPLLYAGMGCLSLGILLLILYKRKKENKDHSRS